MAKQPTCQYPVLYFKLQPVDHGYAQGYRFMVEQADGDRHWFYEEKGRHGSERFIQLHALAGITPADMELCRRELKR